MSYSKPATLSKLTDSTLGCFSRLPPSEFVDHLVRYLSTWSGSDKFFSIIQSSLSLLAAYLNFRARVQHRYGRRASPTSDVAARFSKFCRVLSSSRTLYRFWGLIPILQWMISLERNPQPTRNLLNIERLQGWSMLGYYPLEHLSFLRSQDVLPPKVTVSVPLLTAKPKSFTLDPSELSLWSCRCWAAYVALHFARLREERKLIQARQRDLRKGKRRSLNQSEKDELRKKWSAHRTDLVMNVANFALALNASSRTGIMDKVWNDVLTLLAAVISFSNGWNATALPSKSTSKPVGGTDVDGKDPTSGNEADPTVST
ncbi:hypothetical protein E1B28_001455 [Marasmius oreades]|uniref:Uncharacterized protein n=1 Tax=Marasmius oreades TaxID=181124 RepID=A0A9P8AFF1_9AGAR|nr:uncharacterized protein E1B28_001455 [Marasmius oreades]KAG7099627.1 hypothetical protein E1B28_001455 [Marasmius oreades]